MLKFSIKNIIENNNNSKSSNNSSSVEVKVSQNQQRKLSGKKSSPDFSNSNNETYLSRSFPSMNSVSSSLPISTNIKNGSYYSSDNQDLMLLDKNNTTGLLNPIQLSYYNFLLSKSENFANKSFFANNQQPFITIYDLLRNSGSFQQSTTNFSDFNQTIQIQSQLNNYLLNRCFSFS